MQFLQEKLAALIRVVAVVGKAANSENQTHRELGAAYREWSELDKLFAMIFTNTHKLFHFYWFTVIFMEAA